MTYELHYNLCNIVFKYCEYYLNWMGEEIKKLTPKDQVDSNLIKWSFKCYGIFIAQDGSEEDVIFDYNWVANSESRNNKGNYIYIDINNASDSKSIIDLTLNDNNKNDGSSDSLSEENRNDDNNENSSNEGDDYSNDDDNSEDRDGSGEENRNDNSDNKNSSNEGDDLNDQEDHEEDTYYEDKAIENVFVIYKVGHCYEKGFEIKKMRRKLNRKAIF
ncbi:14698_t:CDS:2, partial [Gigaspora margarita]